MVDTQASAASFQILLEQHRKIVFKVAGTYARNADDRADLAQEIGAQAWRAFAGYDTTRSFSTWLYRIALNVAISFVRSAQLQNTHSVALDDEFHDVPVEDDGDAENDERVRALYRVIDRFDPLNRALLLLYLDEHSYRDIAEILGITETNVATKISRLRQRLRTDLADHA